MTIVEAIRDYVLKCPFLDELARVGIDYQDPNPINYAIQVNPAIPTKKIYSDGMKEKQVIFDFIVTGFYGLEWRDNIENNNFFERFIDWIEENNDKGILPEVDSNKEPLRIEILTNGYIFEEESDKAKYLIQLSFNYLSY